MGTRRTFRWLSPRPRVVHGHAVGIVGRGGETGEATSVTAVAELRQPMTTIPRRYSGGALRVGRILHTPSQNRSSDINSVRLSGGSERGWHRWRVPRFVRMAGDRHVVPASLAGMVLLLSAHVNEKRGSPQRPAQLREQAGA